jgi:hypothetical protein
MWGRKNPCAAAGLFGMMTIVAILSIVAPCLVQLGIEFRFLPIALSLKCSR